jgi:hypothetical protein
VVSSTLRSSVRSTEQDERNGEIERRKKGPLELVFGLNASNGSDLGIESSGGMFVL